MGDSNNDHAQLAVPLSCSVEMQLDASITHALGLDLYFDIL